MPSASDQLPPESGHSYEAGLPPGLWEDLRRAFEPRYELRGLLGRGGMGVVIEAWDPVLERPLAIKILSPGDLSQDPTARERLLREARAAATLSHPNVVSVFGVGETPELRAPYILMQRVLGETLERKEQDGGTIGVAEAVRLLGEIAEALTAAHARGMVHRDLKPSNVMVEGSTGRAVVLDFGISHFTPTPGREQVKLTGTGMQVGTPLYMSPEQAAGEPATDKSDIYSLGCLMYEVLSGRPVFEGPTAMVVMASHIKDTPAPIKTIRPDVPLALERTLTAMLAKDPAHRPSADDLRRQFAPVPESHPWSSGRLTRVRVLLRSAGFLGVALGGMAAVLLARFNSAAGRGPGAGATLTTVVAVLLGVLAVCWAGQLFRAYRAASAAGLSWDLVTLLAGDGAGEAGRIVDRLQRFALLSSEAQRALLGRKRVIGTTLLTAGPWILFLIWTGDFVRRRISSVAHVELLAFGMPFLWLLYQKQRHDRLERVLLGETALTIRGFRLPPLDPAISQWLSRHRALIVGAGGLRLRGALTLVVTILVLAHVALLGLVQLVATAGTGYAEFDRSAIRARYAQLRPLLATAVRVGPLLDGPRATAAWDSLYGIGVDSMVIASAPEQLSYWEHRKLFPGTPNDTASWGNEMSAALHGLSPAQRAYLTEVVRWPTLGALESAARTDRSEVWTTAIRRAAARGTTPWEESPGGGRLVEAISRSISRAALLVADGKVTKAEHQLRVTMRVARLRAEAGRATWDWMGGVRNLLEVNRALSTLHRERGAEARIELSERWNGSIDAPADTAWSPFETLADTTLPEGVRWGVLWQAMARTCDHPAALWAARDPALDSVADAALHDLAHDLADSVLVRAIQDQGRAAARRLLGDAETPVRTRLFARFALAMGRPQLAGCTLRL